MFGRKKRPPEEIWNSTPSRLGWSLYRGRLVQTRAFDRGRRVLIRDDQAGDFPFPEGLDPYAARDEVDAGLWILGYEAVEVASAGCRVATIGSDLLETYMLHNRHAELILYRIAYGMLYPPRDLYDTLVGVPALKEGMDRIDLFRLQDSVGERRVPTADEMDLSFALYDDHEKLLTRAMSELQDASGSDEQGPKMDELRAVLDAYPLNLDRAPYVL